MTYEPKVMNAYRSQESKQQIIQPRDLRQIAEQSNILVLKLKAFASTLQRSLHSILK